MTDPGSFVLKSPESFRLERRFINFLRGSLSKVGKYIMDALLASYSITISGAFLAAWFFAFETRKTFKGGIFWNAWRIITYSVVFFAAYQLVVLYGALNGPSFSSEVMSVTLEGLATALLLVGFFLFYKAWNPRALTNGS